MKNKKLNISIVVILLVGVALLSVAITKTLLNPKNSQPITEYSYNNIAMTGEPINNGEFIFGGGTYRDVNLRLKLKIPVGWSISLGGSGNIAENEFESAASLRIHSNNQAIPKNGVLTSSDLIQSVQIDSTKYDRKNAGAGIFNTYSSYEDAVAIFSKTKDEKNVVSFASEDILLANKYKAHKFDIEYNFAEGGNPQMRYRTLIYVYHPDKLYKIYVTNTDFYNSPQVQEILNSIEFYE